MDISVTKGRSPFTDVAVNLPGFFDGEEIPAREIFEITIPDSKRLREPRDRNPSAEFLHKVYVGRHIGCGSRFADKIGYIKREKIR
jgi:hypothetical protein